MWTSVGLTLLVGLSLGLVADRILFRQDAALASPAPTDRPVWFLCSELMLDAEDQPGYYYPEKFRTGLLKNLSKDLDLTGAQQAELETMLESRREGAREFWESMRHAYCDVRDQFRSDIRELLEPEQRMRWDEMIDRLDEQAEDWAATRAAQRK